jgi:ATP-dependent DNA ligase
MAGIYRRVHPMHGVSDGRYLGREGFLLQRKYDGTRAIVFRDGDQVIMRGRSWKNDYAPKFPEVAKDLKKSRYKKFILDAELTFFKGKQDAFLTVLATREVQEKEGVTIKLMVFDIIELNGKKMGDLPIEERLKVLKTVIPSGLKHVEVVKTFKDPKKFKKIFADVTRKHGEGVFLKAVKSKYLEGAREDIRSEDWVKVKKIRTGDCVIVGMTKGLGWREPYFGALILGQYANGKLVPVGNASGFDTDTMKDLNKKLEDMPKANNPFTSPVSGVKKYVAPKLCVEVKYMERTKYGIMRHPIFLRVRNDKLPKDCRLEDESMTMLSALILREISGKKR